jgi:hypothetical protein
VKPPIPSREELEALNEQLAKLVRYFLGSARSESHTVPGYSCVCVLYTQHHKDTPDFVTSNAWEIIQSTPARPFEEESTVKAKHESFGRIPEYLLQRKEQWAREEEERRRNMPDPDCPPGMVRLDEDERVRTLGVLTKSLEQAQFQVSRLPLRIETLRQTRRKDELLARLQEIEDAIRVFSKPKVYVAKPESATTETPPKKEVVQSHRRFRRPSQSNATAA